MLAPTGVAAVDVDGVTIHSALSIHADRNYGKSISNFNNNKRCFLRNKYSEVSVIINDEISMVSNRLFLHIHQRLVNIFACSVKTAFVRFSVIVCGDFYQLPPIKE